MTVNRRNSVPKKARQEEENVKVKRGPPRSTVKIPGSSFFAAAICRMILNFTSLRVDIYCCFYELLCNRGQGWLVDRRRGRSLSTQGNNSVIFRSERKKYGRGLFDGKKCLQFCGQRRRKSDTVKEIFFLFTMIL